MVPPAYAQKKKTGEDSELVKKAREQWDAIKAKIPPRESAKIDYSHPLMEKFLGTVSKLGLAKGSDAKSQFKSAFGTENPLNYYQLFGGKDKAGKTHAQFPAVAQLFTALQAKETAAAGGRMQQAQPSSAPQTARERNLAQAIISVRGARTEMLNAQERLAQARQRLNQVPTPTPGPTTQPATQQARQGAGIEPALMNVASGDLRLHFNRMLDKLAEEVRASKFNTRGSKYKVTEDVEVRTRRGVRTQTRTTQVPETDTVQKLLTFIEGLRARLRTGDAGEYDTVRKIAHTIHYIVLMRNDMDQYKPTGNRRSPAYKTAERAYDEAKKRINKESIMDQLIEARKRPAALRVAFMNLGGLVTINPAFTQLGKLRASRWYLDDDYRLTIDPPYQAGWDPRDAAGPKGREKLSKMITAAEKALSDSGVSGPQANSALALIKYAKENIDKKDTDKKEIIPDKSRYADRIYGAVMGALARAEASDVLGKTALHRQGADLSQLRAAITLADDIFSHEFSKPAGDSSIHPEWSANILFDALNKVYPSIKVAIENAFYDPLGSAKDNPGGPYNSEVFEQRMLTLLTKMKDEVKTTPWESRTLHSVGRNAPSALVTEFVLLGRPDKPFAREGTETSPIDLQDVKGGLLTSETEGFWRTKLRRAKQYKLTFPTTIEVKDVSPPVIKASELIKRAKEAKDATANGYSSIPLGTQGPVPALAPKYKSQLRKANQGYIELAEDYIKAFDQLKEKMDKNGDNAKMLAAIKAGDLEIKHAYDRAFYYRKKAEELLNVMKANKDADIVGGTVRNMPVNQHRVIELIDMAMTSFKVPQAKAEVEFTAEVAFNRTGDVFSPTAEVTVKYNGKDLPLEQFKREYRKDHGIEPIIAYRWFVFQKVGDSIYLMNPRYTSGGNEPQWIGQVIGDTVYKVQKNYPEEGVPDMTQKTPYRLLRSQPMFKVVPKTRGAEVRFEVVLDDALKAQLFDRKNRPAFMTDEPKLAGAEYKGVPALGSRVWVSPVIWLHSVPEKK